MAKCLFLSVGLVKEKYAKEDILGYLKRGVSRVTFGKLIIFASEKSIESCLNEFVECLKENEIEFTVFPGEDKKMWHTSVRLQMQFQTLLMKVAVSFLNQDMYLTFL